MKYTFIAAPHNGTIQTWRLQDDAEVIRTAENDPNSSEWLVDSYPDDENFSIDTAIEFLGHDYKSFITLEKSEVKSLIENGHSDYLISQLNPLDKCTIIKRFREEYAIEENAEVFDVVNQEAQSGGNATLNAKPISYSEAEKLMSNYSSEVFFDSLSIILSEKLQ